MVDRAVILLFSLLFTCCHDAKGEGSAEASSYAQMADTLRKIVSDYPGEIGVGFISDAGDTVVINNDTHFPMMSVFKLHQGIATCRYMDQRGISLDSIVKIPRRSLNASTWSPMLKDIEEDTISISIGRLLTYSMEQSDNNASNYLFQNLLGTEEVATYISTLIPASTFQIRYTEADMLKDHQRAYENYTYPLAAAEFITLLYEDSTLVAAPWTPFIRQTLDECKTGTDRIVAPLTEKEGVIVGHKTGSGFRDNGVLTAHNDVAFVRLPDGKYYSLAVFIKDFAGTEAEASRAIARISAAVYEEVTRH